METWATVILVLGTGIISAGAVLITTRIQESRADKRLEKEHHRAQEAERRERKQQVRSEPLLKFRSELATVAAKQTLIFALMGAPTPFPFDQAVEDMRKYIAGGDFLKALYTLDEAEIIKEVEDIVRDWSVPPPNVSQQSDLITRTQQKIQKVQSRLPSESI